MTVPSTIRSAHERLLIWGAGGHGKVVADVARAAGHSVLGFVDADPAKLGSVVEPGGAAVIMDESRLFESLGSSMRPFDALAIAIGNNRARLQACARVSGLTRLPVLVHPSAVISPSAALGEATVVMPMAVVNPAARVGIGVIVNTAAIVEHDCVVGDGAHLSPNSTLAGGVHVGSLSWIGAGATVIQQLSVGRSSIVGAGAVVIRDVADEVTVVGCPARVVR
ncbi:MAG: acetyltransferase [Polyangiaceae bacterium]|nr:acetyltransferase [Polyangiaceae bacterium]